MAVVMITKLKKQYSTSLSRGYVNGNVFSISGAVEKVLIDFEILVFETYVASIKVVHYKEYLSI